MNIVERYDWLQARMAELNITRGDAALAVVEGVEGADAEMTAADAEIAGILRELATLKAAKGAAARRAAEAASKADAEARAVAGERLLGLTKERVRLLQVLCEGVQRFEADVDAVTGNAAEMHVELQALGLKVADVSALIQSEFERRLSYLIRVRLQRFGNLGIRRTGNSPAPEDFAKWVNHEVGLLNAQLPIG